ncbi:hypothetical protein [Pyrobaculum neutrophilum]|uniref:Uncharacterized protein n=1 Tax=Pyrobaculum neutrophilum (strain DSM 2338 / JCM 9278 / NBRC 100436 / V24Sta) TaxID=444157 RepID=B1Y8J9_PYRNV|nr:hypothetical protein [Pyrobaculum neutrophilum]ACB40078.1 conserved hypothetical protein [Pyrobaculum neutrophilum V24Sta]
MPRSYFYEIYRAFKEDRYEDGLNSASRYRTYVTAAAFRKIYNSIVKPLEHIAAGRFTDPIPIAAGLARLDVIIEYQKNRGLLQQDLAEGIKAALAEIRQDVVRRNLQSAKKEAEALKLALDAVLAYQIVGGRRREEEEEWL